MLSDERPGDTTTGYKQGPTAPGDICAVYGLIDLGTTDNIHHALVAWKLGNSQLLDLSYSSDGSTWTPVFSAIPASTVGILDQNISAVARYVMVKLYGPYALELTDFRISATSTGTYYPVLVSFSDSGAGLDSQGSGPLSTKSFTDSGAASDVATKTVGRPTIAQGGSLAIASLGSSAHAALTGTWEVDWGTIDVGDSFTSNGWLLTWDGTNITVNVPLLATPSIGTASFYTAYYESVAGAAPVYVQFDVMPGSVTVKAFTDSGAASDSLSQTGQLCSFTDHGSGADVPGLMATISFTDSGGGSDAPVGPANPLAFTDSGVASDAISVGYTQQVADAGYAWEQLSVNDGTNTTVFNLLADYGAGSDVPDLNVTIPFMDVGIGSDATDLSATLPFTDSGAASDVATAPVQFSPGGVQVFLD